MIGFVIGALVGLIVGWNFLPQPEWVLKLVNKAEDKVEDIKK